MQRRSVLALAMAIVLTCGVSVQAVTMEWVTVGDPCSVNDDTGYGGVDHPYRIGKYEVSNNQYCEFLNAVAANDTYGLYDTDMNSSTYGGINRSGSPGSYSYSVKSGRGNNPVNYVSWCDSIRFANWMHNGQGSGDTETGAYTITGGGYNSGTVSSRNSGAQIFLPTENEWYKAAYYKAGGISAGYWEYATASDTVPNNNWPAEDTGNSANYGHLEEPPYLTDVGAYTSSGSAYGTFDQNGNLFEWTETLIGDSSRRVRGGSWGHSASCLDASYDGSYCDPNYENPNIGFRVASIPEPPMASFQGLGDLAGGEFQSRAHGVSGDGSVVVGTSESTSGTEAFRWTASGGMVGLGDLEGGEFGSLACGASYDGAVVVGHSYSTAGKEAFRWTSAGGMIGLGDLPGGDVFSSAYGVSADGSVVVGGSRSASGSEAFRWTFGSGMVGLGDFAGGEFHSVATGISGDGLVIVGYGYSALGSEAFRWTSGSGLVGLGDLPGGDVFSAALGISVDGAVVVGDSKSTSGVEAFRWTAAEGMIGLGDLPGWEFYSVALDASASGSIIVGQSYSAVGPEAFLWTENDGMVSIKEMLENDYGLDLTGWELENARGISADGLTIVGWGINPDGNFEGWIATTRPIGGYINWVDLVAFCDRWLDAGCSPANWCGGADIDLSGNVDFTDFGWLGYYWEEIAPAPNAASSPNPNNTASGVSIYTYLNWTAGTDTAAHGVYFGTNATPDANDFQGYQTNTSFDVGTLEPATTYYWQIEAVGLGGTTLGDVWSFTTAPVPGQASNPNPTDTETGVDIYTYLSWTAGSDTTSFDVYFGTNPTPDVNEFWGNLWPPSTMWQPGPLDYETTYYWRIDALGPGGTTTGVIWSFTTMIDPNLVGRWWFNETSGNIAYDSSGNENHGTLFDGIGNGLVWEPDEGALNFDGTNNLSRVSIPTTQMTTTAGTFTIWANLAEPQNREDGRNGSGYFFGLDGGSIDKILLYMNNGDTQLDMKIGNHLEADLTTLSTETWYHIALTWDAGAYAIYLNGSPLDSGTYSGLSSLPSAADIGNNGDSHKQSLHGLVGEVQVYDRALSDEEIQQLYQDGQN